MGSVRSFALILNSVEDGSAIFSLFEESVRRRETSFALCNEYDSKIRTLADLRKCFSNIFRFSYFKVKCTFFTPVKTMCLSFFFLIRFQ
jgi:hypothetical protein